MDAHYNDIMLGAIASQITSLTIVYSTVYSDADQRKHQSSASLAFVWGIHRGPVNSSHKWPATRKMFSFDDVIMLKFDIYKLHWNAAHILTNINRILGQYTWYDTRNLRVMFSNTVRYSGVRRVLSRVMLLPYLTTNCIVHFEIDTFTHDGDDGYVQFSTNLAQKRLSYQNGRSIHSSPRPPVVHSPYSQSYESCNTICIKRLSLMIEK